MIITLLMSLEGSRPEISRLINVEDQLRLDALAHVIDAAFGFSGTAGHLYIGAVEGAPALYSASPSGDERDEASLSVGDLDVMTYVYDPAANWNVRLEVLGVTDMDTPSPMLIDAHGPDVIEACGGPEMMTSFHLEARRIAAGLEPDMKISPLLLSFLPVMSPERLIQRLAYADYTTVAERIAFTSEALDSEFDGEFVDDPRAPEIAHEFDSFVQSRPDLQQILAIDPNPERNPALIAAISEFFSDHVIDLGDDTRLYPFTRIITNIRAFVDHFHDPKQLASDGSLRSVDVRTLAEAIGLDVSPGEHREDSVPPVAALRSFLQFNDYLTADGRTAQATPYGAAVTADPDALIETFQSSLEHYYSAAHSETARENLGWVAQSVGLVHSSQPVRKPADSEALVHLLVAVGILSPESTPARMLPTPPGVDVLKLLLELDDDGR